MILFDTGKAPEQGRNILHLVEKEKITGYDFVSEEQKTYMGNSANSAKKELFYFNEYHYFTIVILFSRQDESKTLESLRKKGAEAASFLNRERESFLQVLQGMATNRELFAFLEGFSMGSYQFHIHKSLESSKSNTLEHIRVISDKNIEKEIDDFKVLMDGISFCRDLVNEPLNKLNAVKLAGSVCDKLKDTGIETDVFNKKKIESLRMGGILAVNKGSEDPPVLITMEWKPESHYNSHPLVLIGKGVVYDTGGMNLKPGNSMDHMKSDMAGAAAVASALYVAALQNIPLHIVGVIPATDNRPGGNAVVPDDIITMHNGMTVEIVNTDAEGRLILADAISYASRFKPELTVTIATLTGSAARAIGKYGIVAMEQNARQYFEILTSSGERVYERLAGFPFWEEYDELIESEVADLRNVGTSNEGGAIIGGKFLSKFVSSPFIHLDIAGTAFSEKKDSYRGQGATASGVRLFVEFFEQYTEKLRELTNRK